MSALARETARERESDRERATERREMEGARALARGGRRWPEMVNSGQRVWWQWVQRREREHARERARERDSARERQRERESARWWPEEEVAWWLHWPEGVV